MKKSSPEKEFIMGPAINMKDGSTCMCNECPHMKKNTLEKLRDCLKFESPEITISEELRLKALVPIERMLSI